MTSYLRQKEYSAVPKFPDPVYSAGTSTLPFLQSPAVSYDAEKLSPI